ncbi:MAG: TolC family protein, partial [Acidobacteriaceae bacterium]|nr:TolC family protein [Acidobacteriaceae bacterium]
IALTIENNLDVELQRFGPRVAESDVLRAQGGGLLRGVPLTLRQLPQGVGGPGAPLLSTVGGTSPVSNVPSNFADLATITEQTVDLSVLGSTPLSNGVLPPSFDPAIVGTVQWQRQSLPQASVLTYGTTSLNNNNWLGNVSLQKSFETGGTVSIGYNQNYVNSNGLRADYNPYTSTSLGITVTQPLLQGFSIATNRRFIRIARNNERITDFVFRQQLIETVAGVIRLYWDLVSLIEDVRVKQQALALAQKLYEDNKAQVEVGTLAPLELKRAQAEVARSRQDLTSSENLVAQQELLMKNVITRTGPADPLLLMARIVPLDHIEVPAQEDIQPVQDLLAAAVQNRPDLAQAGIQLDNSNISLKGSKNELLPQLNFIGSLQNGALTGDPNSNPAPTSLGITRLPDSFFLGGFGNTLGQLFGHNFPNYTVGVQLDIPLKNRVAQADVVRDELQVRQSEVRLRALQNQIRLEVQNALVALQRARATYDAAVETRQLQEEAFAAEQERFTVGASTSFIVIQYQRDLEQARSTEVVAKNNYAKARAALDRAVGSTLVKNDVDVQDAYRGHVAKPPSALPPIDQK